MVKKILLFAFFLIFTSFSVDTTKVEEIDRNTENDSLEIVEELLLGGEDEVIITEEDVSKDIDSAVVSQHDSDSISEKKDSSSVSNTQILNIDTTSVIKKKEKIKNNEPENKKISKLADTISIEDKKIINFDKTKSEYKSPKTAMLLSFLVPGVGQAYVKNNIRAGIYGAVEAAFLTLGIVNEVKGNKKDKEADDFAKTHFSLDKFVSYYEKLKQAGADYATAQGMSVDTFVTDSIVEKYFLGTDVDSFKTIAMQNSGKLLDDYYYKDISFVQGWDDAVPTEISSDTITTVVNGHTVVLYKTSLPWEMIVNKDGKNIFGGTYVLGYSYNMEKYDSITEKAKKYHDNGRIFLTFLVINHIVSAVDAFIAARNYNYSLLNKKKTFLHRIKLEQKMTLNTNGFNTYVGVKLGF